jgi:signal transduction histidine kinase
MKHRDGQQKEVDISEGSISLNGRAARLISLRDITERKKIQSQLEVLLAEERRLRGTLQSEIDKRSNYTLSLVQELKGPLVSISSSLNELEARLTNEIYLALVKNIRRATENFNLRIDEMIELANGEVGMLKIEPVEMDIAIMLNEIVSEMVPVAATKGLLMFQDIPDLPRVNGDRGRLRQVMNNLLSNAIKFTNRGSILIKASRLSYEEVLVQVRDTGRGMNAEELANVFDPYRRKLSSSHDMRGLGIGLALSKMFVGLHRGRIWAESTPGKGSMFSFTVPVYRGPAKRSGS